MGKTVRKNKTKNILHNEERNHHNSLLREFKMTNIRNIKNYRNLIDERSYDSDRMKAEKKIQSGQRRSRLKEIYKKEISCYL